MIDWNKRNHELRVLLFDGFYSRNPQEAVHKIITQEQALIAKLESDKAELLEALKAIKESIYNDCIFDAQMIVNTIIQKIEGSKCPTCNGEGSHYDDETGIETCPDCRGKGVKQ